MRMNKKQGKTVANPKYLTIDFYTLPLHPPKFSLLTTRACQENSPKSRFVFFDAYLRTFTSPTDFIPRRLLCSDVGFCAPMPDSIRSISPNPSLLFCQRLQDDVVCQDDVTGQLVEINEAWKVKTASCKCP